MNGGKSRVLRWLKTTGCNLCNRVLGSLRTLKRWTQTRESKGLSLKAGFLIKGAIRELKAGYSGGQERRGGMHIGLVEQDRRLTIRV